MDDLARALEETSALLVDPPQGVVQVSWTHQTAAVIDQPKKCAQSGLQGIAGAIEAFAFDILRGADTGRPRQMGRMGIGECF